MIEFSIFPNVGAQSIKRKSAPWGEIVKRLTAPKEYPSKASCPLIKLATFGDKRTERGSSLRSDENMLEVFGLVGDYDDEQIGVEEAAKRLENYGIEAFFYTSASHTPEKPRWRVLAPLSKPYPASEHNRLLGMLDEALGWVLAEESFTASQTYYYGRVEGVQYETGQTHGICIDELDFLLSGEWKGESRQKPARVPAKTGENSDDYDDPFVTDQQVRELRSALTALRADNRDLWVEIGHALKTIGERGRSLWLEWSQTSLEKYDPADAADRWDGFKPSRTGYAAVFTKAQDAGWVNPGKGKAPESKPALAEKFTGDIDALFADLTLQDEDVQKMADAEFLIPDMIVRGHVAAYVSPGNGGKTTIFIHLCERLAAMGLRVMYINVDGSPGDLKRHHAHAKKHGYQVLAPDAKDGKSTGDVLAKLRAIAEGGMPCNDVVFILDTLKKFVDVIDKRQAKELYKLFRSLTVKGATVCLLGHTNKHAGEDGKQVFEGTADLRNDVDELIYLDSFKNEATNCLEVTTRPDKIRAEFSPKSFIIDLEDRSVTEPEKVIKTLAKDAREVLEHIKQAIHNGNHSQKEIIAWVEDRTEYKVKKIRAVLKANCQGDFSVISEKETGRGRDLHYSLNVPFEGLAMAA